MTIDPITDAVCDDMLANWDDLPGDVLMTLDMGDLYALVCRAADLLTELRGRESRLRSVLDLIAEVDR